MPPPNEIYENVRFLSACEALWRISEFEATYASVTTPSVVCDTEPAAIPHGDNNCDENKISSHGASACGVGWAGAQGGRVGRGQAASLLRRKIFFRATPRAVAQAARGSAPPLRNTELAATPQSNRNLDENKAAVQNNESKLTGKVVAVAASPVVPSCSVLEMQPSATKKRRDILRLGLVHRMKKKTAKKLFMDDDAKNDGGDDCAGARAEPRSGEDDA